MTDEKHTAGGVGGRSHLGTGSRITGDLYFPGTVELPGYVKGRVEASDIVIEEEGEVEGELHAEIVTIKGHFDGKITGGKVALQASAQVSGEIFYESLSIEKGARVEAECRSRPGQKDAEPVDQAGGSSEE